MNDSKITMRAMHYRFVEVLESNGFVNETTDAVENWRWNWICVHLMENKSSIAGDWEQNVPVFACIYISHIGILNKLIAKRVFSSYFVVVLPCIRLFSCMLRAPLRTFVLLRCCSVLFGSVWFCFNHLFVVPSSAYILFGFYYFKTIL